MPDTRKLRYGSILSSFFSHPLLLVLSCLCIFAAGENAKRFYAAILLTRFPLTDVFALFAYAGITVIMASFFVYKNTSPRYAYPMLNLLGGIFLFLSVTVFLIFDNSGYSSQTLQDPMATISVVQFFIVTIYFNYRYITVLSEDDLNP